MPFRSPFDADWPRYALAAHVSFWIISAAFVIALIGSFAGVIGGQTALSLFWLWIGATFVLGLAAVFSGKLYHGNQVFTRSPMTGCAARAMGIAVLASAAFFMWLAYELLHMRGG